MPRRKKTTEEFIAEVEDKFPGKYLLDRVQYKNCKTKIEVGCKKHGYWKTKPSNLLSGYGCPKCNIERQTKTTEEFIAEVEDKFPGKWLLDRVDYKNNKTKIQVGCKKHGYWKTKPNNLLNGKGCPKCNTSKGEELIESLLQDMDVKYKIQKRFSTCKDKIPLPFDFYLPNHNLLIEYDGRQHFEPVKAWGGEKKLKDTQRKDWIKTKWAKQNKIKLVRFDYLDEDDYIRFILEREIGIQEKLFDRNS